MLYAICARTQTFGATEHSAPSVPADGYTLCRTYRNRLIHESKTVELTLQAMKTLSELMDQALDLHGDARAQWLAAQATGPNAALYPHLVEMLDRQARMDTTFLVSPARADFSASATAPAFAVGGRVGPYLLEREIGRGGMGVVWLATRADGAITRKVALKLPMLGRSLALADRFARARHSGATHASQYRATL